MDQISKTPTTKAATLDLARSASIKLLIIGLIALALLIGSIGLFIALAITMFISRKINFPSHENQSLGLT